MFSVCGTRSLFQRFPSLPHTVLNSLRTNPGTTPSTGNRMGVVDNAVALLPTP